MNADRRAFLMGQFTDIPSEQAVSATISLLTAVTSKDHDRKYYVPLVSGVTIKPIKQKGNLE